MSQTTGAYAEPTSDGVKDFTRKHEPINFRIDADVFEAARALPGEVLAQFATRFQEIGNMPVGQQVNGILDALGLVLIPESASRFSKRLGSLENPIELEQAMDVLMWLLERYGLRPTQPSSNSADGLPSQASGTNSTDAPQQPEQISPTFLPAVS